MRHSTRSCNSLDYYQFRLVISHMKSWLGQHKLYGYYQYDYRSLLFDVTTRTHYTVMFLRWIHKRRHVSPLTRTHSRQSQPASHPFNSTAAIFFWFYRTAEHCVIVFAQYDRTCVPRRRLYPDTKWKMYSRPRHDKL